MSAATAKRRRGRPETPAVDYGPRVRLDNGTSVIVHRADPDMPNAPDIRAARAYVAYEHLPITPDQMAAAKRIYDACAAISGAKEDNGGSRGGRAFWQVGGPTPTMMQAAADLRAVAAILGRAHGRAVLHLVANGAAGDIDVLRGALTTMAAYWAGE